MAKKSKKKREKTVVCTDVGQAKFAPRTTYTLTLTRFEVLHLRDLFSIALPTDVKQTVSQGLAAVEDREIVEAKLWRKVAALCANAGVPTDDAAPDFVCAASQAPPVGVFRLAHDPQEGQGQQDPSDHVLNNLADCEWVDGSDVVLTDEDDIGTRKAKRP
jgi:hypothetical protein